MKLLIAILILFTYSVQAQTQTGREIMDLNDQQLSSDSENVKMTMELINKKGKKRLRDLTRYSMTDSEDQRSVLIRFTYPTDVSGTGFLSIEHAQSADDQWLFLPALNRTRRISPSNDKDNFVGSDFTYEDINAEDLDDYNYKVLKTESIDNEECFVVEAFPNKPSKEKQSGYSKRILYIQKGNYMIRKVEFFDKQGELLKILTASDIRKYNNGKWRSHSLTMKNVKSDHSTVLKFDEYEINTLDNKEYFSLRYLTSMN